MTDLLHDQDTASREAIQRFGARIAGRIAALHQDGNDQNWLAIEQVLEALLLDAEVIESWGIRWHATATRRQWDDFGFLDESAARAELDEDGTLICRRTVTLPVEVVAT